jgi:SAM-dependent methyltransferase
MNNVNPWWQTFFSGWMVEGWLQATTDEQTRQEAVFIRQKLGVAPPARLLDVPCGGGRHSLALAAEGFHMTGVDISPEFLEAARASAAERKLPVTWEQRDMRELPWQHEFDGAFCFGNSFGYADEEANADFVKAIYRALKTGARFILDASYLTEGLLPVLEKRSWYEVGGFYWLSERRYDPLTGRLHVDYTLVRNGETRKSSMSARLYTYQEIACLFMAAGFADLQGFASLSGEPFAFGSRRLLMVGTKQ